MSQKDSFFNTVKHCLYDPGYFQKLVSKTFFNAIKYLYLLFVLTLLIGSVKLAITLIPQAPSLVPMTQNIKKLVQVGYPKELTVTVKNGQLSTNVNEPYYIDWSIIDKKTTSANPHFITIDTRARYEDFEKYNTAVLITKTGVITRDDNKTLKIYPFEKSYNFVINKNKYDQLTNVFLPYIDYLPVIIVTMIGFFLIFSPLMGAPFMIFGWLIYVLFAAVLFFIIAKILKKELTYKKVYTLSLYGLTLPIILETFKNLIPRWYPIMGQGTTGQIWSWTIQICNGLPKLLYFILMILVVIKFNNQTGESSPSSPQSTVPPPSQPVTPSATVPSPNQPTV